MNIHPLILEKLNSNEELKIDIGCGISKKIGFIGIDKLPLDGVDIVFDFENGLNFIPDNSVDIIYSSHLVEHIENLELFFSEIHRILKKDGKKIMIVPHFSNPYYYSDYTHKRFFGLYSMNYFSNDNNGYKRGVPSFYNNIKFKTHNITLKFRCHPFYFRNKFRALFTKIINSSKFMQEWYESSLTGYIPCQELIFEFSPIKD